MIGKGFAGKILHVDLRRKKVWTEPLSRSLAETFIGGLGICIKLAADLIPLHADPLSESSVFVLGAGTLVGTDLPSSSRLYAVAKLPATGTVGWCGAGGYTFGAQLKYAGYDHIVVYGKSDAPVYLHIENDKVTIENAGELWGLSVEDTCRKIYREIHPDAGVITIGQAGEHRSRISMAFVDQISTLGRGGFGAVLGAKNLKAVVVRGTGGVDVFDRKGFRRISRSIFKSMQDYPYLKEWQALGMLKAFPLVPVEVYHRLQPRRTACISCPVGCKEVIHIPDGPFAGLEKHTSSAINLFTPMIYGVKDPWEAVKIVTELDAFGIDMFEFFGIMTMARKLCDTDVLELEAGEPAIDLTSWESMTAWAQKVALRQGTGSILADGFSALLENFGTDAEREAPPLIKGVQPYAGPGAAIPWDRFGTMELGQVLDPRGPHVGSGGSPTYFALRPLSVFPKHLLRMGVPESAFDRILGPHRDELHIGRLLRYSHSWFATLGSLGLCARGQVNRFYNAEICAAAYEAATGIPTPLPELRKRVTRVWKTYRELNIREGLDEAKEALPEQWFKEAGFKDYLTGEPLSQGQAEEMKKEYFEEWEEA